MDPGIEERLDIFLKNQVWDTEYRRLFRACYGAAFAQMTLNHIREGKGAPTPEDCDRFSEEAKTIGAEAAERAED